jgi:hypothetical protein
MNRVPLFSLILLLLLALQFAVFNHIYIGYGFTIYVYVLFFLILPFRMPGWLFLLLACIVGLGVDSVFNTGGIHAFSSVFVAFARPRILKSFEQSYDKELAFRPGIQTMGFLNFLKYSLVIVFIHNFLIFYLEVFHLRGFFYHLFIVIVNTVLTTFVCLLLEALFKKEKFRS